MTLHRIDRHLEGARDVHGIQVLLIAQHENRARGSAQLREQSPKMSL
jgi:hypothetical protein